jgi:hypothetical protein
MKSLTLFNRPGLAAALGALLALVGQGAFNKVFDGLYSLVVERQQFPMTARTIEYYRHVADPCSPQVRNTIEGLNARIEYEHAANQQWFLIDWASTDRWNAVQVIEIQCDQAPAAGHIAKTSLP